jgi:hypothetical protein
MVMQNAEFGMRNEKPGTSEQQNNREQKAEKTKTEWPEQPKIRTMN